MSYYKESEVFEEGQELDLTNFHLHDLQEVDIQPKLKVMDLTANRLKDIDARVLGLNELKSLCLRQNLLTECANLNRAKFSQTLLYLSLQDNQLQEIPALHEFKALQKLELSYNQIKSMEMLRELHAPNLSELYLANNKIQKIEGLENFAKLKVLELGSNKILKIENIDNLELLEELWLGLNRVSEIQNLYNQKKLRVLSLQSNRVAAIGGLDNLQNLEELHLSHNGVIFTPDLQANRKLRVLDLSSNRLKDIESLQHQKEIQDLWLNSNQLESFQSLENVIMQGCGQCLVTLYSHSNPFYEKLEQQRLEGRINLSDAQPDVLQDQNNNNNNIGLNKSIFSNNSAQASKQELLQNIDSWFMYRILSIAPKLEEINGRDVVKLKKSKK